LPAPLVLIWTIRRSGSGNRNSEVNIWDEDDTWTTGKPKIFGRPKIFGFFWETKNFGEKTKKFLEASFLE